MSVTLKTRRRADAWQINLAAPPNRHSGYCTEKPRWSEKCDVGLSQWDLFSLPLYWPKTFFTFNITGSYLNVCVAKMASHDNLKVKVFNRAVGHKIRGTEEGFWQQYVLHNFQIISLKRNCKFWDGSWKELCNSVIINSSELLAQVRAST